MAKIKKSKGVKKSTTTTEDFTLYCEATGRKTKIKDFNPTSLLEGDVRVFSSRDVGVAHLGIEQKRGVILVHIKTVFTDPKQNTRRFSKKEDAFLELIESIKVNGILQPITVIRTIDHAPCSYRLVAGYRRFAAAKILELEHIPIRVVPIDANSKVISLLENIQRENPGPMEVAQAVQAIMAEGTFDKKTGEHRRLSQREVARFLGMGQSRLNDLLKIAGELHPDIQKSVMDGDLPVGKAAILAQLPPANQLANLDAAIDMDNKTLRTHVQEVRQEIGDIPTLGRKPKKNVETSSGVKYRVRPVSVIVDLLEKNWLAYKAGEKKLKKQIAVLQYVLGLIGEISPDIADLDVLKQNAREAKKAKAAKKKAPAKKKGGNKAKAEEKTVRKAKKGKAKKATLPKAKK